MPHQIEQDLVRCEAALYEMQKQYPVIAKAACDNRYIYDQARADAIDEIDHRVLENGQKAPTLPVQAARATQMVAEEMKAAREAESDLKVADNHIKILGNILTSIQTRSKLYLAEMSLK